MAGAIAVLVTSDTRRLVGEPENEVTLTTLPRPPGIF